MVNSNNAKIYSEVYGILNILDKKYKEAIPKKLYNFIDKNRSLSYNPTYDKNLPLNKQNISSKAAAFICMLHYNYWCESEQEKKKINIILKHNQEKKREKYFEYEKKLNNNQTANQQIQSVNINNDNAIKQNNIQDRNMNLVPIKKEGILTKIIKFIKILFKKK